MRHLVHNETLNFQKMQKHMTGAIKIWDIYYVASCPNMIFNLLFIINNTIDGVR